MKVSRFLFAVAITLSAVACSMPALYVPGGLSVAAAKEKAAIRSGEYIEVGDGERLFVFEAGNGAPLIVVPGGPGFPPAGPWPGLESFGDRYRSLYFHQRGSGLSDRPVDRLPAAAFPEQASTLDRRLGIARQLLDIDAIRSALGAESITLAGHSFGGFLAALYAAEFPDRVDNLLLIAPADVVRLPAPGGGLYGRMEAALRGSALEAQFRSWMGRVFDYGSLFEKSEMEVAALNAEFIRYWGAVQEAAKPEWGGDSAVHPSVVGGWIQPACFLSMGSQHDYSEALGRITAPTLVIQGDRDAAGAECGAAYAQAIPGARLAIASGAGHFPQEDGERFAALVREFLSR